MPQITSWGILGLVDSRTEPSFSWNAAESELGLVATAADVRAVLVEEEEEEEEEDGTWREEENGCREEEEDDEATGGKEETVAAPAVVVGKRLELATNETA